MAIIKTEGIVIGETAYSESSKILKVFTKDHGIISVMAKGCKKPKSTFHEASNKLIYAIFDISYKESGISTLVAVDIIQIWKNILMDYRDLEKKLYAFSLVDLSIQIAGQKNIQEEELEKIYEILLSCLCKIDEDFSPSLLFAIAKLKYLEYLGVKPSIDGCSNCGKNSNIVTASASSFGYVCSDCYQGEKIISKEAVKLLRMLYYVDISRIKKLDIEEEAKKEIEEFLEDYYEEHTGIYSIMKKKRELLSKLNGVVA